MANNTAVARLKSSLAILFYAYLGVRAHECHLQTQLFFAGLGFGPTGRRVLVASGSPRLLHMPLG